MEDMEEINKESSQDSIHLINNLLNKIDKEREREILSRRFGLFERKETLEQIGEMLGITRERVRQLEKTILVKIKTIASENNIPELVKFNDNIKLVLSDNGGLLDINHLTNLISKTTDKIEQSRIAFISLMSNDFIVIPESDLYYTIIGLKSKFNEKKLTSTINNLVKLISDNNSPCTINDLMKITGNTDEKQLSSLANSSKLIAYLNNTWGLVKWPTVNPKNIRDKIYVILKENGKQMHFSEISNSIKKSDFKRKNVTTQAIHNELIKDKRFVLVGRGIYALKEWGYQKGTVSDIITKILKNSAKPMHKDEIVKIVLKDRFVKETTILLNLQNKKKFNRVAKATYSLNQK